MNLIGSVLLAILSFAPQDKSQEDVIQMKGDSKFLFGRVLSMTDKGVDFQLRDGAKVTLEFKDMLPSSVYKIKADRAPADDAKVHLDLGQYCLDNGLFNQANLEFDKAGALDKSLADLVKKKKEDCHNDEARSKFEEMKRLGAQKKYTEALEALNVIRDRFSDTPYFEEARKESQKLTEELAKDNEAKAKAIADKKIKKDEEKAKGKEDAEKTLLTSGVDALEEAKNQYMEGLEQEMKPNITKAGNAWKLSEAKLMTAKLVTEKLVKSNDVNMIKQAKELDKELDAWLVRTYYRLGRLYAAELVYTEAMVWLNKGLKLAPDDPLLNGIQLTLTQLEMRKRASSKGN